MNKNTQGQLAEVFFQIADYEKQIENLRQILCQQKYFTPFSAFQRLDSSQKDKISAQNIRDFLQTMGIIKTVGECQLFIQAYDMNLDNFMNYQEFLRAILTADNQRLRIETSQRVPNNYLPDYGVQLSYDVEYSMAKLISKEIELKLDLETAKTALHRCQDFTIEMAFEILDQDRKKFINQQDLEIFLRTYSIKLYQNEIDGLSRRLDFDNDAVISFSDFQQSISIRRERTVSYHITSPVREKSYTIIPQSPPKSKVQSAYKTPQKTNKSQNITFKTPIGNKQQSRSRAQSAMTSKQKQKQSFVENTDLPYQHTYSSAQKNSIPSKQSGQKKNMSKNNLMSDPYQIQKTSQSKYDDLRAFVRGKMAGLRQQSVMDENQLNQQQATIDDRQYSSAKKKSNFKKTPVKQVKNAQNSGSKYKNVSYTRTTIENAPQSSSKKSTSKKIQVQQEYSPQQPQQISRSVVVGTGVQRRGQMEKDAISYIMKVIVQEKRCEIAKQDLALRPDFNIVDFFRYVDRLQMQRISSVQLEDFLRELGVKTDLQSIFLFIRKYDTDNDGKLNLANLEQAMMPRQPEYASMLRRRAPKYPSPQQSIYEIYSQKTQIVLRDLFRIILECENEIEGFRKILQAQINFDYNNLFQLLDIQDDSLISQNELQIFFQNNKKPVSERDLEYFLQRFNLDRERKLSYGEFVEELAPKSNI